jgi:hypothetical protein
MTLTLRELSALVSTIFVIFGTVWYIVVAISGEKVKPILASWIVFAGTMTLSFATYWTAPKHSLISNACNAASVISTLSILGTVWYLQKGKPVQFSGFQKICLWTSAAIAVLWVTLVWGFKGSGIVPNILTQVLMVIGYLVTVQKLWSAKQNTESIITWGSIMIASIIALYTGIVSDDTLAILYSVRAAVASATIVVLMVRIELREDEELERFLR